MGNTKRELNEVLAAIEGSNGIKMIIAKRLGVTRPTLDSYLEKWKTAAVALKEEEADVGDIAKSIVVGNLRAASNLQNEAGKDKNWAAAIVESADAKWWLKMKLRDEFSERSELTGPDGSPLVITYVNDWRND